MDDAERNRQDQATVQGEPGQRLLSLDAFRGLTILVMIFVNDVSGVNGTPAWMKHVQPPAADGMTFVDVVFPAFLFIVGTSIPFAIGGRLRRGQSLGRVWLHILQRTLGLLILGVFMVNEHDVSERCVLSKTLWTFLLYLGAILAWNALPRQPGPRRIAAWIVRGAGMTLLIALAYLFRGMGEPRV